MRSKLLGWPTSIAFASVATEGRGSNRPVSRYAGTTSFALVAATNRSIGRPARFASRPAVRLPKLPLGVENTISPPSPLTRRRLLPHLRDGVKVVHRLRQQPPDVDRVRRRQPHAPPQIGVAERVARQPMTVVEAAGDGVRPHVPALAVEHRQLRFLRRADAAVGIQDDDAGVRDAVEGMRDGAAGVAGGRGEDGERLAAAVERRHQPRHHARADVLEGEGRPVKQLEGEDAGLDLDERDLEVQRLDDDRFERRRIDLAARERPQRAQADFGERAARQARQLVGGPRLDRFRARRARRRAPAPRTALR